MKILWILPALIMAAPSSSFAQSAVPKTAPPAVLADANAGQTVFLETFDNNDRQWPIKTSTGGPGVQAEIVDGSYQATTGAGKTFNGLRGVPLNPDNAFSIALTVKSIKSQSQGGAGLMFGTSPQRDTFALLITNDKKWALLQVEGGNSKLLMAWSESRYLNSNGSNIISLKSDKGVWTIYLNGQGVRTLPALPFYGAGIGILQTADQVNSFDDLRVQSWPPGVRHQVARDEEKFLPAEPKPAPVEIKSSAVISDRPFGTKAYTASGGNTVAALRVMISEASEGKLRYGKEFRFTGQRGTTSAGNLGSQVVTFNMGDYDTLEAARDVAGAMLVAARSAFGDNSVYFASPFSGDDLEESYFVSSTDTPRLRASTTISSQGHFDGKVSLTFYLQLIDADPAPKHDPKVQKNQPQRKPIDPATLPPRISLTEALKKALAAAPNQFAAITKKGADGDLKSTLRIQGVNDEMQSVMVIAPIAIYSIPSGFEFTKEGALKSVQDLTPVIQTAMGGNVKVSTQEKDGNFETRFDNGKGPHIVIQSSANTIGEGFTQMISTYNQ